MFEEKIVKANEAIKKVADYLKEHEESFRSMNLKLYDAFYYFMSDEMKKDFPLTYADNAGRNEYDDFYFFCEDSYNTFKEDLKENFGIDFPVMQNHIGRTSSFYLHDRSIIEIISRRYEDIDIDYTIENFIDYCYNNQYGNFTEVKNGIINIDIDNTEEYIEEVEEEIDYVINNLYNDVVNYCENIITVYEIIKNFKDNQVEYFKEYLECQEERLQEEKEEEEAIRKEEEEERKRLEEREKNIEYLKVCVEDYENHIDSIFEDERNMTKYELSEMIEIIKKL